MIRDYTQDNQMRRRRTCEQQERPILLTAASSELKLQAAVRTNFRNGSHDAMLQVDCGEAAEGWPPVAEVNP